MCPIHVAPKTEYLYGSLFAERLDGTICAENNLGFWLPWLLNSHHVLQQKNLWQPQCDYWLNGRNYTCYWQNNPPDILC